MKRVLVTGANKGIGLAIVESLLSYPHVHVLLGVRSLERGEAARTALSYKADTSRVQVLQIDVTSSDSVISSSQEIENMFPPTSPSSPPLYAVVNNAGAITPGCLDVNLFGVQRVTEAMAPLTQTGGRIVNVAANVGPLFVAGCSPNRRRQFTNPNISRSEVNDIAAEAIALIEQKNIAGLKEAGFPRFAPLMGVPYEYALSKALVNAYTMASALMFPHVLVNSCSPGFVETDMTKTVFKPPGKTPTVNSRPHDSNQSSQHSKLTIRNLIFCSFLHSCLCSS
eukprot:c14383_g1_i1.p1 GENE.c14383_g1_i1~~c14383_g1_i1.p1  ORF type:complete len:301 (+),score=47.72 c14383_g1_i1:60-905(+)